MSEHGHPGGPPVEQIYLKSEILEAIRKVQVGRYAKPYSTAILVNHKHMIPEGFNYELYCLLKVFHFIGKFAQLLILPAY